MITILDKEVIDENDIHNIIICKLEESISLEFKSALALNLKDDKVKAEFLKDVSAFANSAGGHIVYGIHEKNHRADSLSMIDGTIYTKEMIEQVIQTGIQRKIDGLLVKPVRVSGSINQSIYVISIPESALAPHMTVDKKFYKRYNFESVQMEEYEVRNLYNRKEKTKLVIDCILLSPHEKIKDGKSYRDLRFQITNIGKAIERDYKLIIEFNFSGWFLTKDVLTSSKNLNHSRSENGTVISFFGVSPIFPDEILTIGYIDFGLHEHTKVDTIERGEFIMTLLYTNGVDRMNIKLKDLYSGNA